MYFLGVGITHRCTLMFPGKESEIQVLAGLASFCQTVGFLLRTPWLAKPQKNLATIEFGKFTSVGKYTQLFFMKCIWQSKKLVKLCNLIASCHIDCDI